MLINPELFDMYDFILKHNEASDWVIPEHMEKQMWNMMEKGWCSSWKS